MTALELARMIARALQGRAFVSEPYPEGSSKIVAHVNVTVDGRSYNIKVTDAS